MSTIWQFTGVFALIKLIGQEGSQQLANAAVDTLRASRVSTHVDDQLNANLVNSLDSL